MKQPVSVEYMSAVPCCPARPIAEWSLPEIAITFDLPLA
jgi:hypothetical protein